MINWNLSAKDFKLIVEIAERIERELPNYPDDRRTLIMDLNACHSNGCPLQLEELLNADRFEFAHDIYGIRKAINRRTGELTEDCFVPRYAQPEVKA
jgi:hypothetical protein